jgi:hypothetical protein
MHRAGPHSDSADAANLPANSRGPNPRSSALLLLWREASEFFTASRGQRTTTVRDHRTRPARDDFVAFGHVIFDRHSKVRIDAAILPYALFIPTKPSAPLGSFRPRQVYAVADLFFGRLSRKSAHRGS